MARQNLLLVLAMFSVVWTEAQAAADSAGAPTQSPSGAVEPKPKVMNPMREKEPMPGEMKRDGMMKEDVRKQAMKKDAMMRDAMKKEEMKK